MNERQKLMVLADVHTGEDGYHVWWPEGEGAFSAANLRDIADLLDELNKEWDEEIRREFSKYQPY